MTLSVGVLLIRVFKVKVAGIDFAAVKSSKGEKPMAIVQELFAGIVKFLLFDV